MKDINLKAASRTRRALITVFLSVIFIAPAHAIQKVHDIPVPAGFQRQAADTQSYSYYLRNLPLKSDNKVQLWNGTYLAEDTYNSYAVLAVPLLFNEDLEQCADFSMRLWADYLKNSNNLDKLALYDFYGNKKLYSESGKSFKKYLRWHMAYSNSYSIKLGAKPVRAVNELQAGDMFVQNDSNGGIGHVSVVVDEASNRFGHKIYLVGYSFMPAQEFHIERATVEHGMEGWFTAQGYEEYLKESFGSFGKPKIMRF